MAGSTGELAYEVQIVSGEELTGPWLLWATPGARTAYLQEDFRCDPGVCHLAFVTGDVVSVVIMKPPPNATTGQMRVKWMDPGDLVPSNVPPLSR